MGAKRPKSLVYYNLSYQLFYTQFCANQIEIFIKWLLKMLKILKMLKLNKVFFLKTLIILTTYFNHLKLTYWCLRKSENIYETWNSKNKKIVEKENDQIFFTKVHFKLHLHIRLSIIISMKRLNRSGLIYLEPCMANGKAYEKSK